MRICILGTEYQIKRQSIDQDSNLKDCDGYCDKTSKIIVVAEIDPNTTLDNPEKYYAKVLRHEIIHAFLFESGLHENWSHPDYGHDETFIDWVAVQNEKLQKAFLDAGCL